MIIKSHDVHLYCHTGQHRIELRPLRDGDLPLLYRWSADPEVLYWTEAGPDFVRVYGREMVHRKYGTVSRNALCFLVLVDDAPIGECWLQKMNLPEVIAMYPKGADVRRIDMAIGEKAYWGRGLGTAFVRMLIDYAFHGERVDVLHCFCEDYNPRPRRVWEKNGLRLVRSDPLPQPQKGTQQLHYALTRDEYAARRYAPAPKGQIRDLPLEELQPSQIYLSEGKLSLARTWFEPDRPALFDPLPYIWLDRKRVLTDGHTRAALARLHGAQDVPCYADSDNLDVAAYATCVRWCQDEGVLSIADLAQRVVPHVQFERLWRRRCMSLA